MAKGRLRVCLIAYLADSTAQHSFPH